MDSCVLLLAGLLHSCKTSLVFQLQQGKCSVWGKGERPSELEVPDWLVLMQIGAPNHHSLIGPKGTVLIGQNRGALIGRVGKAQSHWLKRTPELLYRSRSAGSRAPASGSEPGLLGAAPFAPEAPCAGTAAGVVGLGAQLAARTPFSGCLLPAPSGLTASSPTSDLWFQEYREGQLSSSPCPSSGEQARSGRTGSVGALPGPAGGVYMHRVSISKF